MRRLLSFLVVLTLCPPAFAWSRAGHMVVASVMYDELRANHPKTLEKLLAVLKQHPQWDTFQKRSASVPEENRDRYLVMIAARWPDDIRDDKTLSHPLWHYIDYPVTAVGDATPTNPPDADNAVVALTQQAATLKNATATPGDRAVAACWVEHIIGDVHQPMHTVSLYSPTLPKGDRGGNDVWVKAAAGGQSVNLHALWDSLLTNTEKYQDTYGISVALRNRPEFKRDALPEVKNLDPNAWVKESVAVAYHTAYLDGQIKSGTKKAGAMLPPDYLKNAKPAAERRTVLAGYRLADAMVQMLGD